MLKQVIQIYVQRLIYDKTYMYNNPPIDSLFIVQPMSQNTFFGQMVTFHCATNVSGYSLSFSGFKESNEPQTVDTTGDAGSAITGTFTLTQANNGTRVRCSAVPDDDGMGYSSHAAFAYGQGIIFIVIN